MKQSLLWLCAVIPIVGCSPKNEDPLDPSQRLKSDNSAIRYEAVEELSTKQNPASIRLLINALADPDRGVRITAAEALGKHGVKDAVPPLIGLLGDDDMWVRAKAAGALGEIRDKEAVKPLILLLENTMANKPKGAYSTWEWGQDANAAAFALTKITGNDFAFDVSKWKAWFGATNLNAN